MDGWRGGFNGIQKKDFFGAGQGLGGCVDALFASGSTCGHDK